MQSTHFQVLWSCAERAGMLDTSTVRVDGVGFGVVLGEDKKTRRVHSTLTVVPSGCNVWYVTVCRWHNKPINSEYITQNKQERSLMNR